MCQLIPEVRGESYDPGIFQKFFVSEISQTPVSLKTIASKYLDSRFYDCDSILGNTDSYPIMDGHPRIHPFNCQFHNLRHHNKLYMKDSSGTLRPVCGFMQMFFIANRDWHTNIVFVHESMYIGWKNGIYQNYMKDVDYKEFYQSIVSPALSRFDHVVQNGSITDLETLGKRSSKYFQFSLENTHMLIRNMKSIIDSSPLLKRFEFRFHTYLKNLKTKFRSSSATEVIENTSRFIQKEIYPNFHESFYYDLGIQFGKDGDVILPTREFTELILSSAGVNLKDSKTYFTETCLLSNCSGGRAEVHNNDIINSVQIYPTCFNWHQYILPVSSMEPSLKDTINMSKSFIDYATKTKQTFMGSNSKNGSFTRLEYRTRGFEKFSQALIQIADLDFDNIYFYITSPGVFSKYMLKLFACFEAAILNCHKNFAVKDNQSNFIELMLNLMKSVVRAPSFLGSRCRKLFGQTQITKYVREFNFPYMKDVCFVNCMIIPGRSNVKSITLMDLKTQRSSFKTKYNLNNQTVTKKYLKGKVNFFSL